MTTDLQALRNKAYEIRQRNLIMIYEAGGGHTGGDLSAADLLAALYLDSVLNVDPSEIKVDVYRSQGPGGQSVNTTDSAVRITHLPTGVVVTCQDEKSQHKNKAKALKVLRSRLFDTMVREQNEQRSEQRKNQVGSGDRSERIRTYNYQQGRVSDHRIGLTLYKLESILQGDINEIIDELTTFFQAQALKHENARDDQ